MFISIAVLFIICGILFLWKAKKMPKNQGHRMIVGVVAIALIILGTLLIYSLFSGKIVLPLH